MGLKIYRAAFITALLFACSINGSDNRWAWYTPKILHLGKNIPQGDDIYSSGFRAGCNDGISVTGYAGHRMHEWSPYGLKQVYNPELAMSNKDYKGAYNTGYYYCGTAANSIISF